MKELISHGIGDGKVALVVDSGDLAIKLSIPLAKVMDPLKSKVLDKVKLAIPGQIDDMILDMVWAKLVEAVSEGN